MLLSTFQHIKGISANKELELWRAGVKNWDDLEALKYQQYHLFRDNGNSIFLQSRNALKAANTDFFAEKLARPEHYRILLSFPEDTLFLDIETTGLSTYYDSITLIGWMLNGKYDVYVKGANIKPFKSAVSRAKSLVTFNGSLFDIPFIQREYPDLTLPKCHVDLRFLAKRVGLVGGQKLIEDKLGIERPKSLSNIAGEAAALLWYQYRWGKTSALKKLISYNYADVNNMRIILDNVIDRLVEKGHLPLSPGSIYRFAKKKSKISFESAKSRNSGISILPYKGHAGPSIRLRDLKISTNTFSGGQFKVVGIDLTGSEARPTGWCLLDNDFAMTKLLSSDDEIINETLSTKPNIVSIDSPLSLPSGRTSVSDDDPGRNKYGIMRHCERVLKRRGINVYPSLIPSMQKLTARGIHLAHQFRSLGIPVIESYPGAAQDIMGIPRKRASLSLLARGLELFGIKGDFIKKHVSHDELDAITSAIVGLFFWSGKYEALGNEDEEYLIIPDLKIDPTAWSTRKVIGFSGPYAAGKTVAAKYLETKGYHYARFSQILEGFLSDRGIKPNLEALQQIGEEINKNQGQLWFCKKLFNILPKQGNLVIDGLRHPEDHSFMVEAFGPAFFHIHLDSPQAICLKRFVKNRGSQKDFNTAMSHPVESNVTKLSKLSHIVIPNVNSIKYLRSIIIKTINKHYQ